MKAKIYQPAKSATQSAKNEFWLLEFNSQDKPIIDKKMLWTSSSNTQDKVKIPPTFPQLFERIIFVGFHMLS